MAHSQKIIDEELIHRQLQAGRKKSGEEIRAIIQRARKAQGLKPEEAAALLQTEEPNLLEELFQAARQTKLKIYGKRLVLFAPLI